VDGDNIHGAISTGLKPELALKFAYPISKRGNFDVKVQMWPV